MFEFANSLLRDGSSILREVKLVEQLITILGLGILQNKPCPLWLKQAMAGWRGEGERGREEEEVSTMGCCWEKDGAKRGKDGERIAPSACHANPAPTADGAGTRCAHSDHSNTPDGYQMPKS